MRVRNSTGLKATMHKSSYGRPSTQLLNHSRTRDEGFLRHNVLNLDTNSHPRFSVESESHQSDISAYDPGIDYAQVLIEARRYALKVGSTGSDPRVTGSSFAYSRSNTVKVDCTGCHHMQSRPEKNARDGYRRAHSWKASIFFWRKFKKTEGASVTPKQVVQKPRTKSLPSSFTHISRRATSGPLYTDGLPIRPNHRPLSGNLSDSSRMDRVPLSPFVPLKQHRRPHSGPLYRR